jgi:hypothetical protein
VCKSNRQQQQQQQQQQEGEVENNRRQQEETEQEDARTEETEADREEKEQAENHTKTTGNHSQIRQPLQKPITGLCFGALSLGICSVLLFGSFLFFFLLLLGHLLTTAKPHHTTRSLSLALSLTRSLLPQVPGAMASGLHGFMDKQGPPGILTRTYRRRYFWEDGDQVHYAASPSHRNILGTIPYASGT